MIDFDLSTLIPASPEITLPSEVALSGPALPEPEFAKDRPAHGREWHIEKDLMVFLKERGWWVGKLQGNMYQHGWPDLYTHHPKWDYRWIDVKVEGKYSFTSAQRIIWPEMESFGVGIWILTGADELNYAKLFQPPNWRDYWKPSYGELPDLDVLLENVRLER